MDNSGRLLKWAVKLSEYDIQYKPRAAIKAHALADFIVEASYEKEQQVKKETWMLEVDGSSASGSGVNIVMTSSKGNTFEYTIKFTFPSPNNEAEYEETIDALRMCIASRAKSASLKMVSQLVNGQLRGEFEVREANTQKYVEKAKEMIAQLDHFEIQAIPRADNIKEDVLSKLASFDSLNIERFVIVEVLIEKSVIKKILTVININ